MFFNFARFFPQPQQLDPLIAKEGTTLEQILDVENIINEIKGQGSQKFADFVVARPEMYRQLITYIIAYEDELKDRKTQIQYPFYCSEILGSQNEKLIDFLFDPVEEEQFNQMREQLFPYLMSFLEQDFLCITSSGYFAKALLAIIKRRGYDVWNFLENNPRQISSLLKHIDSKHISEIVEKLITLDTQQEQTINFLAQQGMLLDRIINMLDGKSHVKDVIDNICEILCEITSKCMNNIYYNNNEILPFIEKIKKPELLFQIALKSQSSVPYLVLINLVELQAKDTNKTEDDEVIHNQEKDYSIFEPILQQLPANLLTFDYSIIEYSNTNKERVQPFGVCKMNLLRLITTLVQVNDKKVNDTLVKAGLFQALETITLQFPYNNQIHSHFDKIVKSILETNQVEIIEEVQNYLNKFITSLITFIASKHNEENKKLGFIGFLSQLSNYLIEKSKGIPVIEKAMQQHEAWQVFCTTVLAQVNAKEKPFLCNYNPKKPEEPVEDEDQIQDSILNIIKKFNPYQQQPYFADNSNDNNNNNNNENENPHEDEENGNGNEEDQDTGLEEQETEQINGQGIEEKEPIEQPVVEEEQRQFQDNCFWKTSMEEKNIESILNDYK